jgi:hypothetical protein
MTKLFAKAAFLVVALASLPPCSAQIAPPVFNPPGGTYSQPITLQMAATSIANIYYTTDNSVPSANSSVYSGPITIGAGTTTVQAIAIASPTSNLGSSTITSATYTVAPPTSTTQLKTSANPLILPGALTLTATVNPTASDGAVPTGTITFASNTSTQLGTAPLKIVPSTQAWTGGATLGTPLSNPVGLASVVLAKGAEPVLVSAQSPIIGTAALPNVTLYKLSPGGNTLNAYTYTNGNQSTTDAVAAGYFLQPASSSVQSFLVHESYQYQVFDGSTTAGPASLDLNPPKTTSNAGCDCSFDTETVSVADFDGDGYSDLGVLIQSSGPGTIGFAAIVINAGASNPGSFNTYISVPNPAEVVSPAVFCPVAITTGNFLSTAGVQLAVLASAPQSTCAAAASGPFSVYLFSYDATNSTVSEIGTPVALPDNNAATLAAADLNNDGISDLIIGESIPGPAAPIGAIVTALSVGDGTFKAPSAPSALPAAPLAFTINDFNGDGNIDVAYTSASGYSILRGDGAGNLTNRTDRITDISSAPGGITSADLNGDGLADLALVSGSATISDSNLDIVLNSASAQAVLALGAQALAAGNYSLTAAFAGDSNFAAGTSAAVSETVSKTTPVITWVPAATTLQFGTPLGSAQLNATANVPGALTYTPPSGTILPLGNDTVTANFAPTDSFDYAPATANVTTSVVAAPAVATVSAAESTVTAGQQSTITLSVDPYPVAITATATLAFTPAPPNTVPDPAVLFSNNETTEAVTINPSSTTTSSPFQFQAGSTAGTITVTIHLTLANGQDITPTNLAPVTVTVPASAPAISSAMLTRSGKSIQVAVIALSSTRDMTQAQFHFTPVSGKSLKTTDVTVSLTSVFQTWYGSSNSDQYGTNFTYTQPFTLDGDATDIQSVSVTLTNSAGTSGASTAQ